jgi:hypothetical protein
MENTYFYICPRNTRVKIGPERVVVRKATMSTSPILPLRRQQWRSLLNRSAKEACCRKRVQTGTEWMYGQYGDIQLAVVTRVCLLSMFLLAASCVGKPP